MKIKIDDLSYEEFDLTNGLYEILKTNNILYIEDLIELSLKDATKLHGMTPLRYVELAELVYCYLQ